MAQMCPIVAFGGHHKFQDASCREENMYGIQLEIDSALETLK